MLEPASTDPPFLLSNHVTNDRGTFHWETFKTYEKSMRQYWSLMFCKQTGISSLWPINNTEKKRKVSNHNLFNLPDVPWSTIGGGSPFYVQWAHCRGIFNSFFTRTSRGIGTSLWITKPGLNWWRNSDMEPLLASTCVLPVKVSSDWTNSPQLCWSSLKKIQSIFQFLKSFFFDPTDR